MSEKFLTKDKYITLDKYLFILIIFFFTGLSFLAFTLNLLLVQRTLTYHLIGLFRLSVWLIVFYFTYRGSQQAKRLLTLMLILGGLFVLITSDSLEGPIYTGFLVFGLIAIITVISLYIGPVATFLDFQKEKNPTKRSA